MCDMHFKEEWQRNWLFVCHPSGLANFNQLLCYSSLMYIQHISLLASRIWLKFAKPKRNRIWVRGPTFVFRQYRVLPHLSMSYPRLRGTYQGVTNSFAAKFINPSSWCNRNFFKINSARLACLIHTASIHPGPGSNPLIKDNAWSLKNFRRWSYVFCFATFDYFLTLPKRINWDN